MNNALAGKYGESLAEKYLKQKGFKILEKNFRIRGGEIDIIALNGKTVVYVEVKARTNQKFGLPQESVTFRKLKFLQRAAKFYRNARKNLPESERIDVVAIDLSNPSDPQITHIENAGF